MTTRPPAKEFDPIEHFLAFASRLILDTGEEWEVEDFQVVMFKPLLLGIRETWNIIPEGNTKTTSSAGFGLYHCMFTRAPWVPIVASSRDQAEILAQQAYGIIRATPGLEYNKKRHTGYFEILEGYRQIRCPRSGGRGIKVYAADVSTSDGGIPTLVLCDEGHRWPDMAPYRLWKGKLGKRKGQIAMNSTAGEPGTQFEEMRDKIRSSATNQVITGYHGHYEGHQIVMNEWMVDKREYCEDMERVKMANPFSGITVETLTDESPAVSVTTDLGDWVRLKPLAVDTPIPTPTGWTTMLALSKGDEVLNGDGYPTIVMAVTPVKLAECYEIVFSDGSSLVATGDHLWEVDDARNHHRSKVVSTEEMASSVYMRDGRGQPYARWRIKTAGKKVGLDTDLPVDPYVLGVWLGDGSNNTGHVRNGDPEVWEEIEARGYELGSLAPSLVGRPERRMQTLLKLRPTLRALDLLHNKHIPEAYFVAEEDARWELLQGLMDADGTVLEDGRALFWNTNPRLARDVQRLAWSLGRPAKIREDRAILDGEDYGPRFAVNISCDSRHPVVRLSRKAARLKQRGRYCDHRRIKSIVPVGKELVRCIAVSAEDSIFLAGEAMIPTHNCNIAARSSQSAITESEWAKAYANFQIPEGEHMDAGCDVAWKHDTFAIAPLWRFDARAYEEMPEEELVEWVLAAMKVNKGKPFRLLGAPKILTPPRDGSTMHPDVVKIAFEELMDRNPIDTVVIDIERAEDIAAWLEDECEIEVVDRSTGNAMAVEDYDAFIKGLRTGMLRHNGDAGLRKHVMNAIVRTLPGEKKRFDRPSQSRAKRKQEVRVIDALTAAGMINWHWDNYIEDSGEPLVSWR